jgi:hypothetical protein
MCRAANALFRAQFTIVYGRAQLGNRQHTFYAHRLITTFEARTHVCTCANSLSTAAYVGGAFMCLF